MEQNLHMQSNDFIINKYKVQQKRQGVTIIFSIYPLCSLPQVRRPPSCSLYTKGRPVQYVLGQHWCFVSYHHQLLMNIWKQVSIKICINWLYISCWHVFKIIMWQQKSVEKTSVWLLIRFKFLIILPESCILLLWSYSTKQLFTIYLHAQSFSELTAWISQHSNLEK